MRSKRIISYVLQAVMVVCAVCMGANLQRYLRKPPALRTAAAATTRPTLQDTNSMERNTTILTQDEGGATTPEDTVTASSTQTHQDRSLEPYFLCSDEPERCGFVFLHFCLNAANLDAIERTETAEEGFWNVVMAAGRMRALLNASSPIILLTNYRRSHVTALRRAYEENQRVLRSEVQGVDDDFLDGGTYFSDDLVATGGGTVHDTNYERMVAPRLTNSTNQSAAPVERRRNVIDGLDERTPSGLQKLRGAPWPFPNDADVVSLRGSAAAASDLSEDAVSWMRIKPDVLRYLVPQRGSPTGGNDLCPQPPTSDGTSLDRLRVLCAGVSRWMYLDSDTLLQNRSIASWRFKDDDASILSDEALHGRLQAGTTEHLDAVLLRGAVAVDETSRARQRRWSSPLGQALYHVMDLLAHDHVVMVPELNHQRDMGPWLYQDLLNASVYPEGPAGFIDGRAPYAYTYPFERQFNTGLIAFRGNGCQQKSPCRRDGSVGVVHALFERWSAIHQATPRCRNDRVAWDQCSLPRALRALAHTLRVQSTWEPFDARDALGRGCSTILFANTLRDLRMNREHAVVLHRHTTKGFLRAVIKAAWGVNFVDALVFNASCHT